MCLWHKLCDEEYFSFKSSANNEKNFIYNDFKTKCSSTSTEENRERKREENGFNARKLFNLSESILETFEAHTVCERRENDKEKSER